jgi:hypothetical protein
MISLSLRVIFVDQWCQPLVGAPCLLIPPVDNEWVERFTTQRQGHKVILLHSFPEIYLALICVSPRNKIYANMEVGVRD